MSSNTDSKQDEALKPCPFDGGDEVVISSSSSDGPCVHCFFCDAYIFGDTVAECVEKWNTRRASIVTVQGDARCPSCGGAIDEHLYISPSGDKDWKCLDEQDAVQCSRASVAVPPNELLTIPDKIAMNPTVAARYSISDKRVGDVEYVRVGTGDATWIDAAAREIASRPSNMPPEAPLSRMKAAFRLDCIQITAIITKHLAAAVSSPLPAEPVQPHYFVPTETPDRCGFFGCSLTALAHAETPQHNLAAPAQPEGEREPCCVCEKVNTLAVCMACWQDMTDRFVKAVQAPPATPVVAREVHSRLINLAAAVIAGRDFISPDADDNPKTTPRAILDQAEKQRERLRLWAVEIREVADKLSAATTSPSETAVGGEAKIAKETHYLDPSKFGEGYENVNPEDHLSPCPFCNRTELARCWDEGLYWIRCVSCGATGPETTKYSGEEGDPYFDWNSRTAAPVVPADDDEGDPK